MPSRPARTRQARPRSNPRPRPPRRPRGRWPWIGLAALAALVLGYLLFTWWDLGTPLPPTIGIVAGHWQYDSGATCPDGLREGDITLAVARQVVDQLRAQGCQAEVLPEYSDRLNGYRGMALVSLHADSCLPELSGFKIVGPTWTRSASASGRLVDALTRHYAAATGLRFHRNTITPAMTGYHAFHQIYSRTPAAIVEMGFMGGNRELLTVRQDLVARGIVDGLLDFLSAAGLQAGTAAPRL